MYMYISMGIYIHVCVRGLGLLAQSIYIHVCMYVHAYTC